jgi:quercetin dioxygenase-like cupin family protein
LRPDRLEWLSTFAANAAVELAPNVLFDCHVGACNHARNLTTGFVTFRPPSELPCHTHPFTESITVLEGAFTVSVEGREYLLNPLDNIVIPRGLAHAARNESKTAVARVHIALGSSSPSRELVAQAFATQRMPVTSAGTPGKERVTRIETAVRYAAGPGTGFVDYFNRDLVPGIEMSGGYARFQPGGRLPAHVHYFDESICIVEGEATCIVEGRQYRMESPSTALQPRGRVHYFVNKSSGPMAMIWVYAGPSPDRVAVAEACATLEGDPWKQTDP